MRFTVWLYLPAFMISVYKYYITRVDVKDESNNVTHRLGCALTIREDFLYIFGQILLTIVTLGIYSPWACCNIWKRFISKTFIEEI